MEEALGIRPVTTASSGNWMVIALAQAVADHDMAALDDNLEIITACIKRGIHRTYQLNFGNQFYHYVRTTTLINVLRGWDGTDPIE